MALLIRNATQETMVASRAEAAHTFAQSLLGLMFRDGLPDGGGLVLYGTNWIHTFWMRFPIDCIYANKRLVVVGVVRAMPPNRIGALFWRAHAVIELPAGVIDASGTRVGDQLTLATITPVSGH